MKKIFICLLLFFISSVTAQIHFSPFVNDFVVSDDNNPSTFLQEKVKLFANGTKGGIYTWWDYRLGELSWFAQRFDSSGIKVGGNFQIMNDLDICFAPNGSNLVLGSYTYGSSFPGWWDASYSVHGKIYNENGSSLPHFHILSGTLPWCGTGWLGLHHTLSRTNNHYLYFHSSGGPVSFYKYNFTGNLVFHMAYADSLPMTAYDIVCIANKFNEYALFSLQTNYYNAEPGLYATFFSSNDSITANNVLIKPLPSNWNDFQNERLRAVNIQDSIYQIFWASEDSLRLFYWNINCNGTQINNKIPVPLFNSGINSSNLFRAIANMSLTPINNGEYSLLITVREYLDPQQKDYNTLVNFDQLGNIKNVKVDSSSTYEFARQLFKMPNHDLLIPASINGDSYEKRLSDLTVVDSLKLNDDLIGSNETNPSVHRINNQETFISYIDEKNLIGKKINNNGVILTDEIVLQNRNLRFYEDGWAVSHWYEKYPLSYNHRVGISIYDNNFNLYRKIYLNSFQYSNNYVDCQILSDSNIVASFYRSDSLILSLYNRYGAFIKERVVKTNMNRNQITIFIENQDSFLLTTYQHTQMFDNQLLPSSQIFPKWPYYYLGNLKMLITWNDEYNRLFGQITDLNGTALTNIFFLCNSRNDFYCKRLNNGSFAVLFNYGNKIYVKSFSFSGTRLIDSLLIHADVPGYRRSPHFGINNDKVIFTWADARNSAKGYDIYCSIFDLSDITSVNSTTLPITTDEFKLSQNYPNPFNPSTRIQYQVASGSHVTLKVYDVLGNEVATLVDEQKPAGIYDAEFRIENLELSSGVYFYRLRAGNYIQTKKMIILR